MKFMIAVDCDGPACVVGEPGHALSNSRDMVFAREQATRETDAAARALFDVGATQVVVWDNHGFGSNLVFDRLDHRCEVVLGTRFGRRFPQLDESYVGVLMIGYHAMEGTPDAVLAHTYSPAAYRAIRVHGQEVGEMALDASVAGELGVLLILVASDDKGCDEASRFMPWIGTVVTKKGYGRNCAYSKHPVVVEKEIYQTVCRAVERLREMQAFTFQHPVAIEIEFKKYIQGLKARIRRQGWRYAGGLKLKTELGTMLEWRC
ncbi:M55 family metallopeptidase [Desulfoprunum benzoelyticum]|uniref:D-amino peptidase n=1 Tax=Desulfoprunum benzoelyticum TaxID=1506996 RepID=A0A840UUA0_9BACT|nr:M55 family metallopeptidase [Desulfoprunum benzoelyticum]MBB5346974.1 D-amino peptidase [Desulfoprunum benzoelyticum]MBM9531008.1 M55 family metallopeptidase [Desulfoprunum benzoelyticum]